MNSASEIDSKPFVNLLECMAPGRREELRKLLDSLHPTFRLETESESIVFKADPIQKTITVGTKALYRLKGHAYTTAIVLSAMGTPGYREMAEHERIKLFAPADQILTWAVNMDLQQWATKMGLEKNTSDVEMEFPTSVLPSLNNSQKTIGKGLFWVACSFIILHEIGHLCLDHTACEGDISIQQENDADRFAAAWLLECPQVSVARRVNCLLGIATALMWLTVFNVYFGPSQNGTHPQAYDRLFQTLDHCIDKTSDKERLVVWGLQSRLLFAHMDTAEIEIDWPRMQSEPRDQMNYLLDVLSHQSPF